MNTIHPRKKSAIAAVGAAVAAAALPAFLFTGAGTAQAGPVNTTSDALGVTVQSTRSAAPRRLVPLQLPNRGLDGQL